MPETAERLEEAAWRRSPERTPPVSFPRMRGKAGMGASRSAGATHSVAPIVREPMTSKVRGD
jgi:hypothetical protein